MLDARVGMPYGVTQGQGELRMQSVMIGNQVVREGKLVDIAEPEFKKNPFPFYAALRAEKPIFRARMGRLEAWLVTRYDDVHDVLKSKRFVKDLYSIESARQLSHRPWVPSFARAFEQNMLEQDDPNHARLRGLVSQVFTHSRIQALRERIVDIANERIESIRASGRVELVREFAIPFTYTVLAELLGIPKEDRARVLRLTNNLLLPKTILNALRILPSLWLYVRLMRGLLARRKAEPRDDLLTGLVQAREHGQKLSEDEQLAMSLLLIIAGHETTANLISCGMLALLQHPEQLEWIRNHPEAIKPAVEELLRYTSPVDPANERYAAEDMQMHGQSIRRGELVLAVIASANRDESQFTRPDELDLTREPNRHLAFGHGIHFCLGAALARMEAQIAINLLLQRLPNVRLAIPAEKIRWRNVALVRALDALPLRFDS